MHLKVMPSMGACCVPAPRTGPPTGLKRQDNHVLYESSPETVERFELKFEQMWERSGNVAVSK